MNKTLTEISLIELIPSSISGDDTIKALASAVDEELKRLQTELVNVYIYSRLDDLSLEILSHLAWQYKTPYWDEALSHEKKVELIRGSIRWHRRRGTPLAVEEVISIVLGTGLLQEWWEYEGSPYHFKVSTEGVLKEGDYETFFKLVDSVKNKRSVLDAVQTKKEKNISLGVNIGIYRYSKRSITINE